MKTCLMLAIALAAGLTAQAQSESPIPPVNESLETAVPPHRERPIVYRPQERQQIHTGGVILEGPVVGMITSGDPVGMFNPFIPENFQVPDNTVRDEQTGKITGWSILTIRF